MVGITAIAAAALLSACCAWAKVYMHVYAHNTYMYPTNSQVSLMLSHPTWAMTVSLCREYTHQQFSLGPAYGPTAVPPSTLLQPLFQDTLPLCNSYTQTLSSGTIDCSSKQPVEKCNCICICNTIWLISKCSYKIHTHSRDIGCQSRLVYSIPSFVKHNTSSWVYPHTHAYTI